MRVTISNNIAVEQPSAALWQWCEDNLVIGNPEYAKKLRMGFWLGTTPEHLYLYEIRGDKLILPYGTLRELLPYFTGAETVNEFKERTEIDFNANVPLYDYQREAVNTVKDKYFGILQSPAGSGKTQMGIALMSELKMKTLWLTHTKDLLTQSKERAESYIDPKLIGTITEGKVNIGRGVTFATIQTMCRLDLSQYKDEWDLIIVDECHRCSGTPTAITQFYKVLNSLAARYKYGLSATVHRSDGTIKATYALLGQIIYTVPEEAVADKVMKVGVKVTYTGVTVSRECLNSDGTLNYSKLITYLCNNDYRNELIITAMLQNSTHPSLVLSDRLEHLSTLMNALPDSMKAKAVMISGRRNAKAERERHLQDMRDGKAKYLFATYSLAKEGLDIPCLERLYLATPQKDYAVITQSIGRIARTYDGKKPPICYDFVDDTGYLVKAYKKRLSTYRKNGCYFIQED